HNFIHPPIQRSQNRRGPAKASSNDKNLIGHERKPPAKRNLNQTFWQLVDYIENVLMRRPLQKLAAAFPRSPIPRIHNPESFSREKLRQALLARNRRHPIA